jgi:hypothetical protein
VPCVSESNGRFVRQQGNKGEQGNAEDAVRTVADPSFIFQFYMSQFEINQKHLTVNALIDL